MSIHVWTIVIALVNIIFFGLLKAEASTYNLRFSCCLGWTLVIVLAVQLIANSTP